MDELVANDREAIAEWLEAEVPGRVIVEYHHVLALIL